ncbi:uncharacterized protein EV422DRAFT_49437 [Fimicolochytrium jonesii]|uniref:uncharacterized protein n=1 Tax=Fimicolochytrium jonesii TaxID=1396493 RepID=UPI0022FEDDB1|nr:uncharacterized protein EV422DRAFT_49437 [Fimicolochytrium jonesii]KAI8821012.1 hypothetical protein EV422DRAFT_49437 [Fimicolochytrium jonesii]
MHLHWFLDAVLVRLTEPSHIAWVTAALTVVLGFAIVAILSAAMNGLINRGAFGVVDPTSLKVKQLPVYSWLVNNISGSKNIMFAASLVRRTAGNAGLAAFIAVGGTAMIASKLLVASAVIGWATWDFGLCPINATSVLSEHDVRDSANATEADYRFANINSARWSRAVREFMDNPAVTSQNWVDDVNVTITNGCPEWLAVPCHPNPNLAKTIRVRFSDQAHEYLATSMGTGGFPSAMYNVTFGFYNTPLSPDIAPETTFNVPVSTFYQDRVSILTNEFLPSDNASDLRQWTSTVTEPGFRPHLSFYHYIWAPGFAQTATAYDDPLYNFTRSGDGDYGYYSQVVFRPITCITGFSVVERTEEFGEIRITGSTSDLLNGWTESATARGMGVRQIDQLWRQFAVVFRAAVFMRQLAFDIFGSDLEAINSRFYRGSLSTDGLTLESHFAYMAHLQQRVTRAQVMAAFLGNLDQNYTTVKKGLRVPDGRVKCNGYTLSVVRILVVLLPVLLVLLCIQLWDELLPVGVLDRVRRRYPGNRTLWWMVQSRFNRQAVEIMQLGTLVESLLGAGVAGMVVRPGGAGARQAKADVNCTLVRAYGEPHPNRCDDMLRDVDVRLQISRGTRWPLASVWCPLLRTVDTCLNLIPLLAPLVLRLYLMLASIIPDPLSGLPCIDLLYCCRVSSFGKSAWASSYDAFQTRFANVSKGLSAKILRTFRTVGGHLPPVTLSTQRRPSTMCTKDMENRP